MNLRILKDTVEYELREPLFLDKSLGLKDHLRKFLIYMRDTFFNVSGSNATVVLRYKPTIKTADFLLCIAATNINRINSIKYHTYIHIIYQFNSIIQAYVEGTVKDLIAPTRKKFYERVLDLLHTATRKNVPKFEGGGKGRRLLRRRVTRRRRLY
jgi:hypothetical protein